MTREQVLAMPPKKKKFKPTRLLLWLVILVLMVWSLFPIYWMLITSFKNNNATVQRIQTWWPTPFSLEQYKTVFSRESFWNALRNTVVTSIVATALALLVALLLAYAISRTRMKGKRLALQFVLFTYLVPGFLLFIPIYMIMSKLGLINSVVSLLIVYTSSNVPYATWVLITYLRSIPLSLEEAASIDGCSRFGIIWRIVFPLAMPGLMSVGIFSFTRVWNEFTMAFLLLSSDKSATLMLIIKDYMIADMVAWGKVFATSVLASLPVTLFYFLASTRITTGMTLGSVKE